MVSERRFLLLIMQLRRLKERGIIDKFTLEYTQNKNYDIEYFSCLMERGDEKDKENYRSFGFSDVALFDEIRRDGDLENFWFMK